MRIPKPTARLVQVLLWYDEPQIVLLQEKPLQYIVGLAIEKDGFHSPFVGASVSIRQLLEYKLERIDLRYLFNHADARKWWLFDLDNEGDIELKRLRAKDRLVEDAAPDSGFFARSHDEIENLPVQVANSVQIFNIDGTWDLGEFSQFYGQVEDLYYMFHSIAECQDADAPVARKRAIHDALVRPFRGGGSYVALYNDFANDNDRAARLRVSGIQYHSPGYVEVRALEKPFDLTIELLNYFAQNKDAVKGAYRKLHHTLATNKLLKKDARAIFGESLRDLIRSQSDDLAIEMPGVVFNDLLIMTDGNLLIASKVLLSITRRVEKLYQFFDEGRARHQAIEVD